MTRVQSAWDVMRKKKNFLAKDIMAHPKDSIKDYINALVKSEHIGITKNNIKAFYREYVLLRDSGDIAPVYRTQRKRGNLIHEAMVIDKNIDREFPLSGLKTPIQSAEFEKMQAMLQEASESGTYVEYKEFLKIFQDGSSPNGFQYSRLHYYINLMIANGNMEEIEHHKYRLCKKFVFIN